MIPKLCVLQVCNVGQILGGTAACAWTLTRSLPWCEHVVAFLSPPTPETLDAFEGCRVEHWDRITPDRVLHSRADVVILHNTAAGRVDRELPIASIAYLHSRISPPPADLTIYCSNWLAQQFRTDGSQVCHQAVPRPPKLETATDTRSLRDHPVIGRICTPLLRKWPADMVDFYDRLARRFPEVVWEFVGCPDHLRGDLRRVCRGNARFFAASFQARTRLWVWDALLYHHPTLTESFGRTVAEAMRAGCIPIVDRRGGFVEQIPDRCGFLCDTGEQFAEAIDQLQQPGVRFRTSRACRAHADQQFALSRFGRDIFCWIQRAANISLQDRPSTVQPHLQPK